MIRISIHIVCLILGCKLGYPRRYGVRWCERCLGIGCGKSVEIDPDRVFS